MHEIKRKFTNGQTVFVVANHREKPEITSFEIACTLIMGKGEEERILYAPTQFTFSPYAESACFASREELEASLLQAPSKPYPVDDED